MLSKDFIKQYWSVAVSVSNYMPIEKRLAPELILASMSWESADATNNGAKNLNNISGIKYTNYAAALGATQSGMYAKYPSLDAYARDFARVLSNSNYYSGIHMAAKTPGFKDDVEAWNRSAYAEDDYNVGTILNKISEIQGIVKGANGTVATNQLNIPMPDASKMTADDKTKYAIIGAVVVSALALIPSR